MVITVLTIENCTTVYTTYILNSTIKIKTGNSIVVQWLGLRAFTVEAKKTKKTKQKTCKDFQQIFLVLKLTMNFHMKWQIV